MCISMNLFPTIIGLKEKKRKKIEKKRKRERERKEVKYRTLFDVFKFAQ